MNCHKQPAVWTGRLRMVGFFRRRLQMEMDFGPATLDLVGIRWVDANSEELQDIYATVKTLRHQLRLAKPAPKGAPPPPGSVNLPLEVKVEVTRAKAGEPLTEEEMSVLAETMKGMMFASGGFVGRPAGSQPLFGEAGLESCVRAHQDNMAEPFHGQPAPPRGL